MFGKYNAILQMMHLFEDFPRYLLYNETLAEYLLSVIWNNGIANGKKTELQLLHEIHRQENLQRLGAAINLATLKHKKIATLTSVWVDKSPLCWVNKRKNKWVRPTNELADLLIVTWNNRNKKQGKALLLQAKLSTEPIKINRNQENTARELYLMEKSPEFLLSKKNERISIPSPYINNSEVDSTFNLKTVFKTNVDSYRHFRILNIKNNKKNNWDEKINPWMTFWPKDQNSSANLSRTIIDMVLSKDVVGENFEYNTESANHWDRLISNLIKSTQNIVRKNGNLQNISFCNSSDLRNLLGVQNIPNEIKLDSDLETEEPGNKITIENSFGINCIFIFTDEIPKK